MVDCCDTKTAHTLRIGQDTGCMELRGCTVAGCRCCSDTPARRRRPSCRQWSGGRSHRHRSDCRGSSSGRVRQGWGRWLWHSRPHKHLPTPSVNAWRNKEKFRKYPLPKGEPYPKKAASLHVNRCLALRIINGCGN